MILVTLGTQDKPFTRLLKKIDDLIDKGIIKDKVVVQAGTTKYESNNMEIMDLIPMDEFDNLLIFLNVFTVAGETPPTSIPPYFILGKSLFTDSIISFLIFSDKIKGFFSFFFIIILFFK